VACAVFDEGVVEGEEAERVACAWVSRLAGAFSSRRSLGVVVRRIDFHGGRGEVMGKWQ